MFPHLIDGTILHAIRLAVVVAIFVISIYSSCSKKGAEIEAREKMPEQKPVLKPKEKIDPKTGEVRKKKKKPRVFYMPIAQLQPGYFQVSDSRHDHLATAQEPENEATTPPLATDEKESQKPVANPCATNERTAKTETKEMDVVIKDNTSTTTITEDEGNIVINITDDELL